MERDTVLTVDEYCTMLGIPLVKEINMITRVGYKDQMRQGMKDGLRLFR